MPLSLKRKVYNHCILPALTYGAETWSITKQLEKKLRTTLREDSRMGQTWALVDLKQKKRWPHNADSQLEEKGRSMQG